MPDPTKGRTMTVTGKLCVIVVVLAFRSDGGQSRRPSYSVLSPATQDNLTIFPIVSDETNSTNNFLTLDEGLRSGLVVVTEEGTSPGLVRLRSPALPHIGPSRGAEVNRL